MSIPLTKDCQPPLSSIIAPHLPYLRRYARALTGSQGVGDDFVSRALEALLKDRSLFDRAKPPKLALFSLFQATWRGAAAQATAAAPLSRQYLLLTSVEGLNGEEAASVLDIPEEEARAMEDEARSHLSSFLQARVMIIEDEPAIALDIEHLLLDMKHDVVGIADTHGRAVALARREEPDLILADIQLADGSSGVEAVEEILQTYDVPVIFITAYPERLLTGERTEPTYLISKPYRDENVQATVSQALYNHQKNAEAA